MASSGVAINTTHAILRLLLGLFADVVSFSDEGFTASFSKRAVLLTCRPSYVKVSFSRPCPLFSCVGELALLSICLHYSRHRNAIGIFPQADKFLNSSIGHSKTPSRSLARRQSSDDTFQILSRKCLCSVCLDSSFCCRDVGYGLGLGNEFTDRTVRCVCLRSASSVQRAR